MGVYSIVSATFGEYDLCIAFIIIIMMMH